MVLAWISLKQLSEEAYRLRNLVHRVAQDTIILAKVIPTEEDQPKQEFSNYLPISVPCNISKILEMVIPKRVYAFFVNNDILCSNQCGFRPKHSTVDAIAMFTCDALCGIEIA